MPDKKCAGCGRWNAKRDISSEINLWCHKLLETEGKTLNFDQGVYFCGSCFIPYDDRKEEGQKLVAQEKHDEPMETDQVGGEEKEEEDQPLSLTDVLYTGSGHKHCAIKMSKAARLDLLVLKRMYAPHGVRCCKSHLNNNRLLPQSEINMDTRQQ
ncbi:unnamed protein product [Didymodactylos carnosus]|uniref:Uncharacterized protein n=1 Tax=Didymodactylos carnosus TaxID=1234261 RepID=A0A815KXN4_9BILA|nr:unnamed protein product [Didymodactylos carnosus]CAF1398792.1 unnamed protein product [Didymodactylos carnosus]CAF3754683.1 unnamed protein product [Didymodactylos carnosus]CAF4292848.1 unnamed protein product [Didymodactylos carnosus]